VSLVCGFCMEHGKACADTAPARILRWRVREGVRRAAETGRRRVPLRRMLADRLVVVMKLCEQERGRRAMMARWLRCCTSRWRKFWTSGVALRGGGFKPPTGALAEDRGVERRGKRRERSRQVRAEKLSDGLEMVLCRLRRRKAIK